MSNGMQRNVSQRKAVKGALERIETLEQDMQGLTFGINNALQSLNQRQTELATILEAVMELFGAETVDAKIKEIGDRKAQQALDNAKAALEKGLAQGDVVKVDTITEKSLVVGRETDKDGNVVFPGRVQLTYAGIRPEFQEKLKGQAVGFTVETPVGGKFEVLEVYDVVEKPEPAMPEPAATPEAAAPVETPAELEQVLTPSPTEG